MGLIGLGSLLAFALNASELFLVALSSALAATVAG
jgi:hypothetical protein